MPTITYTDGLISSNRFRRLCGGQKWRENSQGFKAITLKRGANLISWGNLGFAKSLQPSENGAPGGIRTPDQVVRSHLLYPAELRVRISRAPV